MLAFCAVAFHSQINNDSISSFRGTLLQCAEFYIAIDLFLAILTDIFTSNITGTKQYELFRENGLENIILKEDAKTKLSATGIIFGVILLIAKAPVNIPSFTDFYTYSIEETYAINLLTILASMSIIFLFREIVFVVVSSSKAYKTVITDRYNAFLRDNFFKQHLCYMKSVTGESIDKIDFYLSLCEEGLEQEDGSPSDINKSQKN